MIRLWLLITPFACESGPDKAPPPTLEKVSTEITYDSVARLGSHHATSSIERVETRGDEQVQSTMEAIEIAWNSWDSFHFQRALDGEATFEVIVHDGKSVSRNGRGPWTAELDGESARLDVYTAWNAWDEALGPFTDRILYEELNSSVVDGRDVRLFRVSLAPKQEQQGRKKSSRKLEPTHIEGTVYLDSKTAVRLQAEVKAVAKQGDLRRTVRLTIQRSRFGQSQPIEAPAVQLGTAGDLLRRLPARRSGRGPDPTSLR